MESNMSSVASSLIEEDILKKLEVYIQHSDERYCETALSEFITWFDNPLLLWDMMHEVAQSPDFYTFIERIHRVCQLYLESARYGQEAHQSLRAIYRQQQSLHRAVALPPFIQPSAMCMEQPPFYSDPTVEVVKIPTSPLPVPASLL